MKIKIAEATPIQLDWMVGSIEIVRMRAAGEHVKEWWHAAYNDGTDDMYGQTLLSAAMRCYVASKLGDEVDVPEELGVQQ